MEKLKNSHKVGVMRKFRTRGGVMRKFRTRGGVMRNFRITLFTRLFAILKLVQMVKIFGF